MPTDIVSLAWFSWTSIIVAVGAFFYFDRRSRAGRTDAVIAALQAQTSRMSRDIATLSRAVAACDPQGVKPTTALVQRAVLPGDDEPPTTSPARRPSRVAATMAEIEAGPRLSAVDTSGDRLADMGPESPRTIRARLEAEADERDRRRAPLPASCVEGDEPPEERTQVHRRNHLSVIVGGARQGDTLPSEGVIVHVEREGGEPLSDRPEYPARISLGAMGRWHAKRQALRSQGVNVMHCGSLRCTGGEHGIAECACECEVCERLATLLADAVREDLGSPE